MSRVEIPSNPESSEILFEKALLAEYFQSDNSIEEVYRKHHYDIPLSICSFRRMLDRYGVVRSAGRPEISLTEAIFILRMIYTYKISLEEVFRDLLPSTIKASITSMYRVLKDVRKGITSKAGEALLVTPQGNPDFVLVAHDYSLKNSDLGHPGDVSLPMGYAQKGEDPRQSITRVMQNEMFTEDLLEKNFPYHLLPQTSKPLFYQTIANVRVAVHHLEVPADTTFTSYKLADFKYESLDNLANANPTHSHLRPGVVELAKNYLLHAHKQNQGSIPHYNSHLNQELIAAYAYA